MANLFMRIKRFPIRGLCVQAAEDSQHGAGLHSPAYCLYVRVGGGNGAASLLPCNGEKSVQRMMRPHMPSVGGLGSRHLRIRDEPIPTGNPDDGGAYGGVQGIHSIAHRRRLPHSRVMCCALSSCIVFPASCVVTPCVPSGTVPPHQAPHHSPRSHPTLLWYTGTLRGEIAVIRNSPCQMVVLGLKTAISHGELPESAISTRNLSTCEDLRTDWGAERPGLLRCGRSERTWGEPGSR